MNSIDDSVLVVDSPRPIPGEGMLQWFRLANALKRFTSDVLYEGIDSAKNLFISFLPVQVIFPCLVCENQFHSISSLSCPLPSSSSAIDSISLRVFFGLLSKYAVSSRAW